MSEMQTRISHGNIGKSKSSHFGCDKFLATSKYETVWTKLPASTSSDIIPRRSYKARRHCRYADDNDKRETGETAISELTGRNYHGLSRIPLIPVQSPRR